MELIKRTEKERVSYLFSMYDSNTLTLGDLKLQLGIVEGKKKTLSDEIMRPMITEKGVPILVYEETHDMNDNSEPCLRVEDVQEKLQELIDKLKHRFSPFDYTGMIKDVKEVMGDRLVT